MGKARAIAGGWIVRGARVDMYFTDCRHQQYIEEIGCACAAQMGMTKTHDGSVADVVTGAMVPVSNSSIRAKLHHSKRHRRAGIGMSMAAGSYKNVDPLVKAIVRCCR